VFKITGDGRRSNGHMADDRQILSRRHVRGPLRKKPKVVFHNGLSS
jgi:hypothetical protein